jgi:hypothetical protein
LGRLSKESVQVRGSFMTFVRYLFFAVKIISPTPNPQGKGPPLVVCPRRLIQYIRSYPLLLEAVPPSTTRGRAMLW